MAKAKKTTKRLTKRKMKATKGGASRAPERSFMDFSSSTPSYGSCEDTPGSNSTQDSAS